MNGKPRTPSFLLEMVCHKKPYYILDLIPRIGMTQAMITAARLIGHKSINGKYQTLMQMDTMEALGQ